MKTADPSGASGAKAVVTPAEDSMSGAFFLGRFLACVTLALSQPVSRLTVARRPTAHRIVQSVCVPPRVKEIESLRCWCRPPHSPGNH